MRLQQYCNSNCNIYKGADIQKGDGIYSRFLPYYNNVHVDALVIEVSDPQYKGYISKTAVIYEDGLDNTNPGKTYILHTKVCCINR